jgi:hypothetical protein
MCFVAQRSPRGAAEGSSLEPDASSKGFVLGFLKWRHGNADDSELERVADFDLFDGQR